FAHIATGTFYNDTHDEDILGPTANLKCSIHHWAEHGIVGRGILLDYRTYALTHNKPYDPYTYHPISYNELAACGKHQGIDIRPRAQGGDIEIGDILMIRSGYIEAYYSKTPEERKEGALRKHVIGPDDGQRYVGIAQEEKMIDWLHDCYFAAVAGDAPSFEAWPSYEKYYLHEYLLALWGVPIGEMFDLERLAKECRTANKWAFFVTSAPANVHKGVSSHGNLTAIL
ncbi:MAG: hypothetical protein M1830_009592, partial [Pleopsidium flavum]